MKIPIVTTDLSFARNICSKAAIYFSPTSETGAAQSIHRVLNDNNLKQSLVEIGLENVERYPNSMGRTKEYLQIIKSQK